MEARFVHFDLETTGLKAENHAIVEIAASANGSKFYSRVKPWLPIPTETSRIHGIFDKDVEDAPTFEAVGPQFVQWVTETVGYEPIFVAYNGRKFDVPFLWTELFRINIKQPFKTVACIDPYLCMKTIFPDMRSRKQTLVYQELFGNAMKDAHSAGGDLKALVRICEEERVKNYLMGTFAVFDQNRMLFS